MEIGANKVGPDNNPFYQDLELKDLKHYVKHLQKTKVQEQSMADGGDNKFDISPKKKDVIDNMSLEELKNFFTSEHRRQEDIERHALREREKSLIDELNMMKAKKAKIKVEREKEEMELGNLLDSFK